MATLLAFVRVDPDRASEQEAFLRSRTTVLRDAGGQFWVRLQEAQIATLIDQGMTVVSHPEADELALGPVRWRPAEETPQPPPALRASEPSGDAKAYWLVRFVAPTDRSWSQSLTLNGAEPIQQIDGVTGIWRMDAATAATARTMPEVVNVGLFHPAYVPALELTGHDGAFDAAGLAGLQLQLLPATPTGNLRVVAFDGVDPESLRPALEQAGAIVVSGTAHGFLLNVEPQAAAAVLSVPGLLAAANPVELRTCVNKSSVILGVNEVRDLGTENFLVNLDGLGEIGAVVDSGFDVGVFAGAVPPLPPPPVPGDMPAPVLTPFHPDLAANMRLLASSVPPIVPGPVPDTVPHGTHVAGIVAGDGTSSGGITRGMAPRAALIGLAPLPGNVRAPFDYAAVNGAHAINNSWGGFPGGVPPPAINNIYDAPTSRQIDRWCFANPEVLVLFASGNNEQDTVPAGGDGILDAQHMSSEAVSKNVFTVGASENVRNDGGWRDNYRNFFGPRYPNVALDALAGAGTTAHSFSDNADHIALFSGRGQVNVNPGLVNTLRVKPEVVAPGTNILSAQSQWNLPKPSYQLSHSPSDAFTHQQLFPSVVPAPLNPDLHMIISGTSMATPMVTGCSLLVRQYYRTRHAQLRRPRLLEGVVIPTPPLVANFPSRPSMAVHPDGLVCAWSTPVMAAATKRIMAMRIGRHGLPIDAAPLVLKADVGDHPALAVATIAERTYLLHRHGDGKMHLSCYDRSLAPVAAFGAAGVVTLAPDARSDDPCPPALLAVNNQLVCFWPTAGGNGGVVQRFAANTGAAVDAAAINLLAHDSTGAQTPLAWDGTRFTMCGVVHGATYQLQTRQMDNAGAVQGAAPTIVLDQAQEIRDPCLLWDARIPGYVLVWCDARAVAGGEIWMQLLDINAVAVGAARQVISVAAANHMRRPALLNHPNGGYVLTWEDDSQLGHFDLYMTALDGAVQVDGRVSIDPASGRRALRLSDSPSDTNGFGIVGDADGFVVIYQNPDEVNSDRIGVYTINLTPGLAFEAQEDPSTPLQKSGRYVVHTPLEHDRIALTPVGAVWTGGSWDILRMAPGNAPANNRQQWLRLTADGVADAAHGVNGIRELPYAGTVRSVDLLWDGNNRRLAAINRKPGGITVHLADANGVPVPGFGAGGVAPVTDAVAIHAGTTPQLGVAPAPYVVFVAYGNLQGAVLHLRLRRLNPAGAQLGAAVNLVNCSGVAAHQWFQFVANEARAVAIYHRDTGANTRVFVRQFTPLGAPMAAEIPISPAAGDSRNAVIARRPLAVNSPQREYGVVWQFRAAAAAKWELRFSRLDRLGAPMATAPVVGAVTPVSNVRAIDGTMADWPVARDAIEPQLVSTHTHEAWTVPLPAAAAGNEPDWSPCWGLAWIGVDADGTRRLYFTMLDENGSRLALPQPPPQPKPAAAPFLAARTPAPILAFGAAGARVRDFRLAWNGRVFMLAWTEEQGGRLRQCMTLVQRHASQVAYDLPTAALLRATLVNGATNIMPTPLPEFAAGYGWGRVNMRQVLSPALPVTFHVRDDCALGPGRSVIYHFTVPAGTALLRVTLNWTDPPGPRVVNQMHLSVRLQGAAVQFRGNVWDLAAGRTHLSRAVPVVAPPAADNHEDIQTFKQVVLVDPAPGVYDVQVDAAAFGADPFNQQNLQPFALVFVGSGPEVRFAPPPDYSGRPFY